MRGVLWAAVAPGAGLYRRRRWASITLLALGLAGPAAWLAASVVRHRSWVALGLDRGFLAQLVVVLALVVMSRALAIGEALRAHRHITGHRHRCLAAALVLLAITVPSVVGVNTAVHARDDIDRAFEDSSSEPLFDAAAPLPTTLPAAPATTPVTTAGTDPPTSPAPGASVTSTTHPTRRPPNEIVPVPPRRKPTRPDSGVDPAELADVTTILLLGGDAGPGRSGLRTDSMILVSLHRPSGRAALISVPRNLERLLFPPGSALEARYPYGFGEIANAVYPIVSSDRSLRDAYAIDGLRPGAAAIAQGIGYSLDVTIDDYVLIDMKGFVAVIDALGGVTVDVPKAVPTPGNPPDALHPVPEVILAGEQYMDGTTALAYVRSRKSDTDYHRANRQRLVLAALARQVSLGDAFTGYSSVVSALGESLRTSLTTDEFVYLLGLLGGETAIVESVGLVPPLVRPERPDYDAAAKIVGQIQLAIVEDRPSGY
jgi:LCP family protein required for cell wall assembly